MRLKIKLSNRTHQVAQVYIGVCRICRHNIRNNGGGEGPSTGHYLRIIEHIILGIIDVRIQGICYIYIYNCKQGIYSTIVA